MRIAFLAYLTMFMLNSFNNGLLILRTSASRSGGSILRLRKSVLTRMMSSQDTIRSPPRNNVSLLSALKDWRKRTADELQRPIYRILPNQVLEDVARLKPRTVEQLGTMGGVGPYTLRQYGKRVIDVVQNYITDDDVQEESGVDTKAFWDSMREQKKAKKKTTTKKKKSAAASEDGTAADGTATKKVRGKTLQVKVMTEDELAELEVESVLDIEELNDEQRQAAGHILQGHNVFVTGSAGTGKVRHS